MSSSSAMSRKMNFWAVFALVTGSQIGSGVFMLPASLAPYGLYSLMGWIISGIGAIALALVFSQLCAWYPQTGGPHVYVNKAFGRAASFFTGWTYWIISWVSTTVVVIASIGYLIPLLGELSSVAVFALEVALLLAVTALNFHGASVAGRAEFFLTLLKIVPLFIIPVLALFSFNASNFTVAPAVAQMSLTQILSRVALLTLWGFIGVESATAPAGSVENASKTIPRAVVAGTIVVALLYLLNSIGIMGVIPGSELVTSTAPYADAVRALFGGNWHLLISLIASVICIGTLNAWMLTSGQIALGLAQDRLMPQMFKKKNNADAPYIGLGIICAGIILLLALTTNASIANQILTIIDFSVTSFLFVYAISCLAFLRLLWVKEPTFLGRIPAYAYGLIGLLFCVWVIWQTPLSIIAYASLFTLCGVPMYWYLQKSNE